jgi:cytochrome c peroxidase
MPGNDEVQTKEQLGRKLFFDNILSKDRTINCSSCHNPEFAFADTAVFSKGIGGKLTARNSPGSYKFIGPYPLFLGWPRSLVRGTGPWANYIA